MVFQLGAQKRDAAVWVQEKKVHARIGIGNAGPAHERVVADRTRLDEQIVVLFRYVRERLDDRLPACRCRDATEPRLEVLR